MVCEGYATLVLFIYSCVVIHLKGQRGLSEEGIYSRMKLRLVGGVKYRKYYKLTRIVRKLGQTPLICSTSPSSYNYE